MTQVHEQTPGLPIASAKLEQLSRVQAILDAAVDAIITIDEVGIVESINVAGKRLFGYPAAEAIGQSINLLMPNPYHGEMILFWPITATPVKKRLLAPAEKWWGDEKTGLLCRCTWQTANCGSAPGGLTTTKQTLD
jgi:PAS domain-containing protein